MKELEILYLEFMGRTPPAKKLAMICRMWQGEWHGQRALWSHQSKPLLLNLFTGTGGYFLALRIIFSPENLCDQPHP